MKNHRLDEGVGYFNSGKYYEAHNVWIELHLLISGRDIHFPREHRVSSLHENNHTASLYSHPVALRWLLHYAPERRVSVHSFPISY